VSPSSSAPLAEFPPVIGEDLLRRLVPMADAIEASRHGFAATAKAEVTVPLRSSLSQDRVLVMPAEHISGSGLIKVISLRSDAWEQGLPSIGGVVLWIDGKTGKIAALLEAAALTALRTGAASGLATALLAPQASHVLAMLGAGDQAPDQIAAVCAVRPIAEVRVYSRRYQRSEDLCRRLRPRHPGITFQPVATAQSAVRGADVICTATRSTTPLFEATDLKQQAHINAVGAYRHDMSEVPPEAFGQASVVVIDQLEAVLAEAGDLVQALAGGHVRQQDLIEIGQLLTGEAEPASGLTIFKSVGIAAQDWSLCELAVRRAAETGTFPASVPAP
jgi:ornithine cyclodeaminase/alanine dehydrogenase-like protein (mu-crystallin family)